MDQDLLVERFFETLITGDRPAARQVVAECESKHGMGPERLLTDLYWPTYGLVERLFREDQLTRISHQLATRLLRVLADRTAALLSYAPRNNRTVFACCGPTDADELGAQMAVDLLEASGFTVVFAGGNIPADEILAQVHETRPDQLLMFASGPSDLPGIREIVDTLREIGAVPNLKVAVGGGVFNRCEGLAEEIGIHLHAETPFEIVSMLKNPPTAPVAIPDAREALKKRRTRSAA